MKKKPTEKPTEPARDGAVELGINPEADPYAPGTGTHKFLPADERTRIAARLERSTAKPIGPDPPRPSVDITEMIPSTIKALLKIKSVPATGTREETYARNCEVAAGALREALEHVQKPTRSNLLAAVRRAYKFQHGPWFLKDWGKVHDAATLAEFGRRHGEKMLTLATGFTPYRTKGKTRGHGISLKRFTEQARPAKGKTKYSNADREAFADSAWRARDALDLFAARYEKEQLQAFDAWHEAQRIKDRAYAFKQRRKHRRTERSK